MSKFTEIRIMPSDVEFRELDLYARSIAMLTNLHMHTFEGIGFRYMKDPERRAYISILKDQMAKLMARILIGL